MSHTFLYDRESPDQPEKAGNPFPQGEAPGNSGGNSPAHDSMNPASSKVIPDHLKHGFKLELNPAWVSQVREVIRRGLRRKSSLVFRPKGWRALGSEALQEMGSWPRNLVWRGMTQAEFKNTVGSLKPIWSTGRFSLEGEGTNFAEDPRDAESYVNFGRDDPRNTNQNTYLVGVRRHPDMRKERDGYIKMPSPLPLDFVEVVWEMYPEEGAVVGRTIRSSTRTAATSRDILDRTSRKVLDSARRVRLTPVASGERDGVYTLRAAGSSGTHTVKIRTSRNHVWCACSCPFWQYQGPEFWAKNGGYLLGDPRGTATRPDKRDPKGQNWCCKHVAAALRMYPEVRGKTASFHALPCPKRVAIRFAISRMEHSWAWISPSGRFIEIRDHGRWAWKNHPDILLSYALEEWPSHYKAPAGYMEDILPSLTRDSRIVERQDTPGLVGTEVLQLNSSVLNSRRFKSRQRWMDVLGKGYWLPHERLSREEEKFIERAHQEHGSVFSKETRVLEDSPANKARRKFWKKERQRIGMDLREWASRALHEDGWMSASNTQSVSLADGEKGNRAQWDAFFRVVLSEFEKSRQKELPPDLYVTTPRTIRTLSYEDALEQKASKRTQDAFYEWLLR